MDILAQTSIGTHTAHAQEWFKNYMRNVRSMVENPPIDVLAGRFEDVTAVVVGAGPSLAKNIHLLRDGHVRSRLLVLASATAYKPMVAAGVRPDVVLAAEKIDMSEYFGLATDPDIRLFINDIAHPSLHFDQTCKERYVVYNHDSAVNKRLAQHFGATRHVASGGNVTTQGMDIAMMLGVRRLILIGHDLSYGHDYRAHVRGTVYTEHTEREWYCVGDEFMMEGGVYNHEGGGDPAPYRVRRKIHWLPGLDGKEVPSNENWAGFHDWIQQWVAIHSPRGLRAINATEGGALIKGMSHMSLEMALAGTESRVIVPDDWVGRVHRYGDRIENESHAGYRVIELEIMESLLKSIWSLVEEQNKPDVDIAALEKILAVLIKDADFMREAMPQMERDLKTLEDSDRILDVMKLRNLMIIHFCGTMIPEITQAREEMEKYG